MATAIGNRNTKLSVDKRFVLVLVLDHVAYGLFTMDGEYAG